MAWPSKKIRRMLKVRPAAAPGRRQWQAALHLAGAPGRRQWQAAQAAVPPANHGVVCVNMLSGGKLTK